MMVEIVETFKKLSDGSILHPSDILDIPQEKALRLIEKGRARLLPSGTHGDALPARFKAGDRVRFTYRTALDAREGVVLEAKWHPAPICRWWYRIESGESKFWTSESHIQRGGVNATGS